MRARLGPLLLATGLVVWATPLTGQSAASGAVAVGVESGVAGTPVVAGLDFTWFRSPLPFVAVRGGVDFGLGALDGEGISTLVEASGYRPILVDLDLVLAPNHAGRVDAPLGAADPFLFGGVGLRNVVDPTGEIGSMVTATYGGGISYWFHANLRFDIEARRWEAIAGGDQLAGGFHRDGWSFRMGAAVHFAPRFRGGPATVPPLSVDTVWMRPEGEVEPDTGAAGPERPAWRRMNVPESRRTVLEAAERYLGTPYVWGGAEPEPGFDCSGFVQHVFAAEGIRLPRPSRVMAQTGEPLPPVVDSLQPGDVLFFSRTGTPDNITHVGIYAGDHSILHATGSGGGVTYDDLRTPRGRWFAERLVSASRVIGVPIMATRSQVPITPETWDPAWDGAPPKEGVEPPGGAELDL